MSADRESETEVSELTAVVPAHSDLPSVVSMGKSLLSRDAPRRACWWATKVGEDLRRPTNVVPVLRKSPIDLPNMPVRRDPDISQVIVRSQLHSLLHGKLKQQCNYPRMSLQSCSNPNLFVEELASYRSGVGCCTLCIQESTHGSRPVGTMWC